MKILVLNCGSSSLKYQLFDMEGEKVLAKGLVEKIGIEGSLLTHKLASGDKIEFQRDIPDHAQGIAMLIEALTHQDYGVITEMAEIDAVGHRTVHGGDLFASSVRISREVVDTLKRLVELAPLHNPPGITGIEACQQIMPGVPMVGVFDTSFHQTMPPSSYIYGIPYKYYEKYGVRRYGFHGTSHRYVSERVAQLVGKPLAELKIITCHLGNGSSIAAIAGGKVLDTSMGFTPLEGLVMGTRSGDLDPAILAFLADKESLDVQQVTNILNKKSGLLGISGVSSDMRYIEEAALEGNERAKLALDVFHKSVLRYIGAYAAELNGADVLVFTAGIGENGPETRKAICHNLTYLGADLDIEANQCRGKEVEITKPGSKLRVFVVPTNEELMIARDTMEVIQGGVRN
ncbi:MAG: acetate kinase [Clostridiales bacterium]|nr:acetate kinase [Clostridiales bacterium]